MDTENLKQEYAHLYVEEKEIGAACRRLYDIVEILRKQCPWDSVQTHESLRTCMIEEAYEAVDAVNKEDIANLREELGDVMLQVVLNSIIARDEKKFDPVDVINEECEKMIRRHPHIFKEEDLKTIDKVLEKWENVKSKEHDYSMLSDRLTGVPSAFPALMRTGKVLKRIGQFGMELPSPAYRFEELNRYVEELKTFENQPVGDDREAEIYGELLFSVVGAARLRGIDLEDALNRRTDAFVSRFQSVEEKISQEGRSVTEMSLEEINMLGDKLQK